MRNRKASAARRKNPSATIVYSVRLELLRPERRTALLRFLRTQHIPDLLAQPGFLDAELRTIDLTRDFIVEYRVRAEADLKRYFKSAAPALRADFLSRFGPEIVRLSREISRPVAATFPAPR